MKGHPAFKCDRLDMGLLFCNDTIKGLTMRFLKHQMLVRLWIFHDRYLASCVYISGIRELFTEMDVMPQRESR